MLQHYGKTVEAGSLPCNLFAGPVDGVVAAGGAFDMQ